MTKTVLYIALSVDGYVADPHGSVAWLTGDGSDPTAAGTYDAFYEGVGAVIMGHSTYQQIVTELAPDAWPYAGKASYVLTHRELTSQSDEITFTQEPLEELITRLRSATQGDIWICGGANLAQQLLAAGLIDQLRLAVIPTVMGSGISLFDSVPQPIKLRLERTESYNGIVELSYEVNSPLE